MSIKLSELKSRMEEVVTTAPRPMTAGEVAGQALVNIPTSALQYGKDIVTPLLDPIGTAKSIGQLGLGLVQLVIPGEQANEKQAKAVGQYFANRYGGLENLKKTIAEDPVGFLGDASIILTGGASVAGKIGPISKTAEKVKSIGQAIDPLTGKVTQLAAKPLSEFLSMTTGVGREAIEQAYKSGAAGGAEAKKFRESIRGKDDLESVVKESKLGVSKLADKRRTEYLNSMKGIKESKKKIDFSKINDPYIKLKDDFLFKAGDEVRELIPPKLIKEVDDVIADWKANKDFHTIEGLDALKRKIDTLIPDTDVFGTRKAPGAAFVEGTRDLIAKKIKDLSPDYAKTMSAYEEAINLEKEIRKSLSLGKLATADQSLRKLLSVMRNNASTNFGQRFNTLKKLEEGGEVSLMSQLAGISLGQFAPRGIQRSILPYGGAVGTAAGAAAGLSPAYLSLLAASSPRLVGEAAYYAGRTLPKTAATRQVGVLSEQAGQDSINQTLEFLRKLQ